MKKITLSYPDNKIRCLTLIGTIISQFTLGSVYTWSLFNGKLAQKLGVPVSKIAFSFGLLSFGLAFSSSMSGKLQERFGVRNVSIGSGVLMAVGLYLASQADSLLTLWFSAGVLVGLADGAGYLMTLSNCIKWFPDRKGIISACIVGSYSLGSLGFKFILSSIMEKFNLETTFFIWSMLTLILVILGSILMKDAPTIQKSTLYNKTFEVFDYSLEDAIQIPQYWMLAIMFLTACMNGLYIIGTVKDIGEHLVHLSSKVASSAVTVVSIANLSGRWILGILSDKISRIRIITLTQIISILGMYILLFTRMNEVTFFISTACIAFSFGGTVTVYPALVSDFFGMKNLTKNYGLIYLGFGIGSILGSLISSLFNSFIITFSLIMTLLVISLIISITIRAPYNQRYTNFFKKDI